jgi:hypothetical protein
MRLRGPGVESLVTLAANVICARRLPPADWGGLPSSAQTHCIEACEKIHETLFSFPNFGNGYGVESVKATPEKWIFKLMARPVSLVCHLHKSTNLVEYHRDLGPDGRVYLGARIF